MGIILLDRINHKIVTHLNQYSDSSIVIRLLRALYCTILDINDGYLNLHAKSLVYTTLMSLVPVLAISFSLLKYLNVHNQIAPMLLTLLEPLGQKGQDIGNYIINFIDNVDVSILGIVGTLVLLYTVISTIVQIEETLNHIWKIRRHRSWARRVFYYLSVIMFSPGLVIIGLLLTASLANIAFIQHILSIEVIDSLMFLVASITPYVSAIIAFTLIYKFLPNTRVELSSAFVGAVSATLAWKTVGFVFTLFVTRSSNYDLIYSGFAALFIFLLWIYISWLIFLLGGLLAYSYQHTEVFKKIAEIVTAKTQSS